MTRTLVLRRTRRLMVRSRAYGRAYSRVGALIGLALLGCSADGPIAPSTSTEALTITSQGKWVERGATLLLHVTRSRASVAPTAVDWTVVPAGAATVSATGAAQLLDTGAVTFRAVAAGVGGAAEAAGTLVVHVQRPPDILVDLHDTLSDSLRVGNRDLYRVALDGRDLVRLTSGAGDNIEPTPSPTDSVVVFTTYRDGPASLFTVALGGAIESAIIGLPAGASNPAVSADGSRLAFVGPSGGSVGLWTSAIDGSGAAAVPGMSVGAIIASPTWCKGGDSIVVVTTAFANASLYVESATSGGGRHLTEGLAHDVNPACGGDGQSVVFSSTRDGDVGLFLSSGGAGSETVRRLDTSPANDGEPTWLQDGRVVFVSAVGTAGAQLAWLDPAQSDSVTLIPIAGKGSPGHPRALLVAVSR